MLRYVGRRTRTYPTSNRHYALLVDEWVDKACRTGALIHKMLDASDEHEDAMRAEAQAAFASLSAHLASMEAVDPTDADEVRPREWTAPDADFAGSLLHLADTRLPGTPMASNVQAYASRLSAEVRGVTEDAT